MVIGALWEGVSLSYSSGLSAVLEPLHLGSARFVWELTRPTHA